MVLLSFNDQNACVLPLWNPVCNKSTPSSISRLKNSVSISWSDASIIFPKHLLEVSWPMQANLMIATIWATDELPILASDELPILNSELPVSALGKWPISPSEDLTDEFPISPSNEFLILPSDELPTSPLDELPISPLDKLPISASDKLPILPSDELPIMPLDELPILPFDKKLMGAPL